MPLPGASVVGGLAAGALGGAGPLMEALAGSVGEVTTSLQGLAGTIGEFVAAISPSTMQVFSQELRNLSATIGSAFVGAIQIVTDAVREISGALLPAMQALTPVVNIVANVIATTLTAAVRVVAAVLESLAPVLQIVADLQNQYAQLVSDLLGVLTAIIRTAADLLSSIFGGASGGIKDAMKSFMDIIRQAVKALVTLVATLAVFAGAKDTVTKFGDELKKEAEDREKRQRGLVAAGTNAGISDIVALSRQVQQAAFIAAAGAGARDKTDTEYLKELAAAVKDTAAAKKSISEALNDWWNKEVVNDWWNAKIMGGIIGTVFTFIGGLKNNIEAFFRRLGV